MPLVLTNQVEASEKSAQQLEEKLRRGQRHSIVALDVRDLAKSAVAIFNDLCDDIDDWQNRIADDEAPDSKTELAEQENEWFDLYRRLAAIFERTANLIAQIESTSPEIESKAAFLTAWRELRAVVSFPRQSVIDSIAQAHGGQAKSLEEVRDALFNQADH